jgi:cell fate (sporulation/competence/biofilm development) regulator YmcA (YheA/YmcA/DUF963 family)
MNSLQELIKILKDDEEIRRFQELEKVIDQDSNIKHEYQQLLDYQKDMVQKQYKKSKLYPEAKKKYDQAFASILSYPVMEEYLDLLEQINADLHLIQSIIETEINIDFD